MATTKTADFNITIDQVKDTVQCPICDDYSADYRDVFDALSEHAGWSDDKVEGTIRFVYRTQKFRLADGNLLAIGCFCPDAPFGDECPACGNHIINTETALIGPRGMCHGEWED